MIDYHTFNQIQKMARHDQLSAHQIAKALNLCVITVKKYMAVDRYEPRRKGTPRRSCLDSYKSTICRLLEGHDYSAAQLLRIIKEQGYTGAYTTLKTYVQKVRPPKRTAFLTLAFAPGECAQIDWGHAGTIQLASTRRQLYFLAVVLAYSRMLYVEFSFRQSMEHFLTAQRHAFEFFGGIPEKIMVDNCKTAVLSHQRGSNAVNHPRYADFARHYGFKVVACNVRAPHEKGQVENAVGYIKKNLLNGLDLSSITAIQAEANRWRDQVANTRIHGTTGKRPIDLFNAEKQQLHPLPMCPANCSVIYTVNSNCQFRITFDANRYSVPAQFASQKRLNLHAYPEELIIYSQQNLIARHTRSYERKQDIEDPEHPKILLQQRRKAKDQLILRQFLAIGPEAETYYHGLAQRRFKYMDHIRQIMTLSQVHGTEPVRSVISDAIVYQAFSAEYIANLLEQRRHLYTETSPLHLTRNADLLDLELEPPNLDIYPDNPKETSHERPT